MFNEQAGYLDEPDVGGDDSNEAISAFVMPNDQQKNIRLGK